VKFLIAGLGSIGRRHMRNLVALGERDLILYRTGKATLPDEELAGFPQVSDLHEALAKHKPDAVIIANPTALHLDVAIPAARAGCAILLEKPVSHSSARLDDLTQAMEASDTKVLMGFQFRFNPALTRARHMLSTGEIGRVLSAHVQFGEYLPGWHPWEDYRQSYAARHDMGGGVVLTQCHALDYLPWLVGRVEAVWGFTARLGELELEVEDAAEIALRFEGGALAGLHLDFYQRPPVHRLEIAGTEGSLHANLLDGTLSVFRPERGLWESMDPPHGWERNSMFLEEMRHFVAVTRGEAQPSCGLQDGIRVQSLVDAIHQSNRSARMVRLQEH
jgi:predicted dehydrogenase